jgi:ubiquinone/menaquinone biosynthesis C-methylase UbiE
MLIRSSFSNCNFLVIYPLQTFDSIVETYDAWYDTFSGQAILTAELKCLRLLCPYCEGHWLEAGVGTGRFASEIGIAVGIDPSLPMLRVAANRGILTCAARAENMPFRDHSFDGILLAMSLCFIADPVRTLKECSRVLRPQGNLLLGFVPGESPWGMAYKRKKEEGHPIYSMARFSNISEIIAFNESAGFTLKKAASSLFWKPDEIPEPDLNINPGISIDAGFIALLFSKPKSNLHKQIPSGG